MVHYHYYIIAGAQCDESTRILKVAVGTSQQSQRDYVFLHAYALQHGHFFHIVDQPTVEFIDKVRRSLIEFNTQVEYISQGSFIELSCFVKSCPQGIASC